MAHNAKKGGEIGANGEFYKGGQFVADNPDTEKGASRIQQGTHKIPIEPYRWIEADCDTISFYNECQSYFFQLSRFFGIEKPRPWLNLTKWEDEKKNLPPVVSRVYEELFKRYIQGLRTMTVDKFISEFGDEYFYARYCRTYLKRHFSRYDASKVKNNW